MHDAIAALQQVGRARGRTVAAREPIAVVRDGGAVVVCLDPVEHVAADGADGLDALDALWDGGGFWVGALAYDLGRSIEPVHTDGRRATDDRGFRDVVFTRFATRVVFTPDAPPTVHGRGASFDGNCFRQTTHCAAGPRLELGAMVSSMSRAEHRAAVAAVHEHLRAGDCYQVNLTRRLTTERRVDARQLFSALACGNPAPHAALVELGDVALVSASPERFLRIDGDTLETRPIKGTHESDTALARSGKDLAEHVMIVDMARNDLGRVCELGRVDVRALATIEQHPGLAHLVSTVCGTVPAGTSLSAVVRAVFPPASITGAPKPRVMQIIDELEPVRRGYYCGAVGWIDADRRRADLAVAIRTFVLSQHGTDLGVGGGVVADSTADGEWHESSLKAARLLQAAGAYECADVVEPELAGAR